MNLNALKKFDNEQAEKVKAAKAAAFVDLIKVMALHRVGYPLLVLKEASPETFKAYHAKSATPAEEVKSICGFFSQQLYSHLGANNKVAVDKVWDGIRVLTLKDDQVAAMEVAADVLMDIEKIPVVVPFTAPKPTVVKEEKKPIAPPAPDKVPEPAPEKVDDFRTPLGEQSDVLRGLAEEKEKRSAASKKAAETKKKNAAAAAKKKK